MKIKQDREGKNFQATDQHAELVVLEGPDADKQIGGNSWWLSKSLCSIFIIVVILSKIITNCLLLLNRITRVDPGFEMVERQEEDAAVTSLPLLDQHVILLNSLPRNVWLLPLGILAVSLRFYGPITDLLQLMYGLLKSIFNSMTGMSIMDTSNSKFAPTLF